MGIHGLLPLLKSIMAPIHIKDFNGCHVAVDTYSWLHKGALSCSKELCNGEPASRHIDYCMHRVNLLRHHGVKPVLVFDGGLLPMKNDQETKRSRARKENLERAIEHESTGNSAAAYECYQKAVDISPSIAYELIQVLKQENIDYVVAPYEADAQMAFLSLNKHVDAVITEDSDLIPFGCSRIVFKMDKFGQGVEFQYSMLQLNKELNFTGFTKQMLLEMCILSGCDYLQSLPGMGLKRAHALVRKFKSYDKVIKHIRYSGVTVPPLYEETFKKAMLTFQHQRVYDPINEDIVHLSDILPDLGDDLDFLGPSIPRSVVQGIAKGDLDPFTKLPFQREINRGGLVLDRTYPIKDFKPESERKKLDLPAQKNVLTNYFCLASREAKKKFKAPRIIPKHLRSMEELSPSTSHHVSEISCLAEEPVACAISCSQGSQLGSGNSGIPSKSSVEGDFATNHDKLLEFSHFDSLNDSEHSISLRQSKHEIIKPFLALHKERECNSALDAVEGKTRIMSRKVIVRSSYFQHKFLDENNHANKNEKLVDKEDLSSVICESMVPESFSFGNNYLKSAMKKRKSTPTQSIENGIVTVKHAQTNATLLRSKDIDDFSSKFMEVDDKEGNFGCNISHLSRYSNIAEKSMERFVSVVSSFRCSTSGSRASGLRAPLKDVRNICGIRSSIAPVELHKFSYIPNNQRAASASQRN